MNKNDLYLNSDDFFDSSCHCRIIHYFQPKSKKLYLHDLEKTNEPNFEEIELNINFLIPENSRSVVTTTGDIYLSGGLSIEKKKTTLNTFYKYNKNQKTLTLKSPFNTERKAHGFIYGGDSLFICGGLNEFDENLDLCEKYDIQNEKWIIISKMIKKSSYFSLATYQNRYIFKFGGFSYLGSSIERYDIFNDKWSEINYFVEIKNFNIPFLCGSFQINERDILVFGGIKDHKETNQSFIFRINEDKLKNTKYYVTDLNKNPLPFDGFCDSISIINLNQAYVLIETLEEIEFHTKFLLTFNGKIWKKKI